MPPLEHFTHEFIESEGPREDMAANADVILADVQNVDIRENLQMLISGRKMIHIRFSLCVYNNYRMLLF